MSRTIHTAQSVQGALANWSKKDWEIQGQHNGMTGPQLKERFRILDFKGVKRIPIGEPCEGFSEETGCPGHEAQP